MEGALGRALHVIGGDLVAVVEANPVAEEEAERLSFLGDLPALGDVRDDVRLCVIVDEAGKRGLDDLRGKSVGDVRGIDRTDVAERRDLEDATATRLACSFSSDRLGQRTLTTEEEKRNDERASSCADRAH